MNNDNSSYERVLITGATGYIGSRLATAQVNTGVHVHVLTRPGADLHLLQPIQNAVTIHEHDGTTEHLIEIMRVAKPDVVFHLASLFISSHLPSDIGSLIKSNVLFGTQLLEAMAENKVNKLINTGTSWQHFRNEPYCPVNLYAATKQALECILDYYVDAHSFSAITLLLFDTYGSADPRNKIFSILRRASLTGETLNLSPGEQLLDMVYIDDVITAFTSAAVEVLNLKSSHKRFGVSSGKPLPLKEFVTIFEDVIGKKLKINWGAREYRTREVMVPWNLYPKLSNWEAKTSLETGIKFSIAER